MGKYTLNHLHCTLISSFYAVHMIDCIVSYCCIYGSWQEQSLVLTKWF